MNGHAWDVVMWLLAGLVSLVEVLIGVIVRMHMNSDKEHRDEMNAEIKSLRNRVHDLGNSMGAIVAREYLGKK